MSVQIIYKNRSSKRKNYNLVLFVDEKFNISSLKKHVSGTEFSLLSDLLKSKDLNNRIIEFDINSRKKIILVSLKKNVTSSQLENLGAKFFDKFK